MRYARLLIIVFVLTGCSEHVDVDQPNDEVFRLVKYRDADSTAKALAIIDSVLALNPIPRYWSDSLAYEDSLDIADLLDMRTSILYHTQDTALAVLSFIETTPWAQVWSLNGKQAEFWGYYAIDTGQALEITHSPNIARVSYQVFSHTKQLALASGDSVLYHRVDSSYKAVARQVLTMPDSVRHAFGPAPQRPAHIPWVLATFTATVLLISLASVWGWKATTSSSEP